MSRATETERQQWLLEQVIAGISRLARTADGQISYLKSIGTYPSADELALELDDVLDAALAVPDLLSERQAELLRRVDDQLSEMSGGDNASLWTPDALMNSADWTRVRELARSALRALHAEDRVAG